MQARPLWRPYRRIRRGRYVYTDAGDDLLPEENDSVNAKNSVQRIFFCINVPSVSRNAALGCRRRPAKAHTIASTTAAGRSPSIVTSHYRQRIKPRLTLLEVRIILQHGLPSPRSRPAYFKHSRHTRQWNDPHTRLSAASSRAREEHCVISCTCNRASGSFRYPSSAWVARRGPDAARFVPPDWGDRNSILSQFLCKTG